jgi:hypothetical protein
MLTRVLGLDSGDARPTSQGRDCQAQRQGGHYLTSLDDENLTFFRLYIGPRASTNVMPPSKPHPCSRKCDSAAPVLKRARPFPSPSCDLGSWLGIAESIPQKGIAETHGMTRFEACSGRSASRTTRSIHAVGEWCFCRLGKSLLGNLAADSGGLGSPESISRQGPTPAANIRSTS